MGNNHCDICRTENQYAGSAVSSYTCQCCGKSYMRANIGTPKICPDCGKKSKRCIWCLATLRLHKLTDKFKADLEKMKDRKYTARREYEFNKPVLLNKIKKQCGF